MLANSRPAIALALSLLVKLRRAQRLAAPEALFEAIPELELDQTENLRAEAGHYQLLHNAGVDAELFPELGLVWVRRWRGAVSGGVCQIRVAGSLKFPPVVRMVILR